MAFHSLSVISLIPRSGHEGPLDRAHHEDELVVAVHDPVFRPRYRAPAVDAAEPGLHEVYAQVGEVGLGNLGRVPLSLVQALVKRVDSIMEGGGGEWRGGPYLESAAFGVEDLPPAYVALGSRLLGTDIGIELFVDALAAEDERISSFGTRLRLAFSSRLAAMDSALDLLAARIKSADPRNLLARGYTLVADASGRVLKSAVSVRPGDGVRVLFADGSLEAEVKSIHSN